SYRMMRADGTIGSFVVSSRPIHNESKNVNGLRCSVVDITELVKEMDEKEEAIDAKNSVIEVLNRKLERMKGSPDEEQDITGLMRGYFFMKDVMPEQVKRLYESRQSWHESEYNFAVIFGDIDLFKNINDTYGHTVGNYVLERVGEVWKDVIRSEGSEIARYGGEEIVGVLPQTNAKQAYDIAEKIREKVKGMNITIGDVWDDMTDNQRRRLKNKLKDHGMEYQDEEKIRRTYIGLTMTLGVYSTHSLGLDHIRPLLGDDIPKKVEELALEGMEIDEMKEIIGLTRKNNRRLHERFIAPADSAMYAGKEFSRDITVMSEGGHLYYRRSPDSDFTELLSRQESLHIRMLKKVYDEIGKKIHPHKRG
ncbi:MAG: GGDEF domain-containing protein, partial [Nanoarchaeota archaeon]|nr:GGDEF domain-containing protein [Nanoarchaeota archaeon]